MGCLLWRIDLLSSPLKTGRSFFCIKRSIGWIMHLCMDGKLELDWIVRRELFITRLVKWLCVVELIPNCIA
jgi:hypothetical protein